MSPLPFMVPKFHKIITNPTVEGGKVAMWELCGNDGKTLMTLAVPPDQNHMPALFALACNMHQELIDEIKFVRELYEAHSALNIQRCEGRAAAQMKPSAELLDIISDLKNNRRRALEHVDTALARAEGKI